MRIMIAENETELRVKTPYNIDFIQEMHQLGAERKNEYGMSFWSVRSNRRDDVISLVVSVWGDNSYTYSYCDM